MTDLDLGSTMSWIIFRKFFAAELVEYRRRVQIIHIQVGNSDVQTEFFEIRVGNLKWVLLETLCLKIAPVGRSVS